MNERLKIKTSGNGGNANTWIVIFLIVIAVHLIVILGIGGFKLLKGDKEILKDKAVLPTKELKPPKEDYLLNLPPEKNTDLEEVLNSLNKIQTSSENDEKPPAAAVNAQSNMKQPANASVISSKQPSVPSAVEYKTYQVGKGDTLNKIATLFHTTPEKLAKMNNISDPRKLKTGMELKVPKE